MTRRLVLFAADWGAEAVRSVLLVAGTMGLAIAAVLLLIPWMMVSAVSDLVRARLYGRLHCTLNRMRHLNDRRIHGAPGWRLHRIGSWVYSHRTFETVFEPVLADMQFEYFAALAEGRKRKATWVRIRGVFLFSSHVVAQLPVSGLRLLWRLYTSMT
jgi:hypothetical protein